MSFMTVVFTFIGGIANTADIFVPDDYSTIQDAINDAVDGDTVIVRPGTYTEWVDFIGKAITLKSERGAEVTSIHGIPQWANVINFISGEGTGSVLDGFTLRWGYGLWGGGIYCANSSPIIKNNIITDNKADDGGGIYCHYSSATITNNIIIGNTALDSRGGGIYCSSSSAIITDNIITGNTADKWGGGIYCIGSSPTIEDNIITENMAYYGGGIYFYYYSSPTIINNTIMNNTADYFGGGISCLYSSPTITNTILWDNSAPTGPEIRIGGSSPPSTLTISYSDVEGGQSSVHVEPGSILNWGDGMIDADPLFADPANNDFHLTWDSPCRNTGDNSAVIELYDFEGDPRIHDGTVDMGADEFHLHLYQIGDVISGSSIDVKVVGPPSSRTWILLGSGIQDPPQATWFGDLCLELPILKEWRLGLIPSNGVLSYPAKIPGWSSGKVFPFQAKVFTDKWQLSNLMALTVE